MEGVVGQSGAAGKQPSRDESEEHANRTRLVWRWIRVSTGEDALRPDAMRFSCGAAAAA